MQSKRPEADDRLRDRFRGALLGTLLGDAVGGPMEGTTTARARAIHREFAAELRQIRAVGEDPPFQEVAVAVADAMLLAGQGRYSDDTQMTIALAEGLLETPGDLDADRIAARFGRRFDGRRGYGPNAATILESIRSGVGWREAVATHGVPGGSYGNGAAMRVAPVALAFYPDRDRVAAAAEEQAAVTGHHDRTAIWGARLQALAVCTAAESGSTGVAFDAAGFLEDATADAPAAFRSELPWIAKNLSASPWKAVMRLGADLKASRSVPFALWCFLSCPDDPIQAVARAATVGGDSDTVGAMTGAIAGAYHGASALGAERLDRLENGEVGRDTLVDLADGLWRQVGRS